jgi:hypothetical protein
MRAGFLPPLAKPEKLGVPCVRLENSLRNVIFAATTHAAVVGHLGVFSCLHVCRRLLGAFDGTSYAVLPGHRRSRAQR